MTAKKHIKNTIIYCFYLFVLSFVLSKQSILLCLTVYIYYAYNVSIKILDKSAHILHICQPRQISNSSRLQRFLVSFLNDDLNFMINKASSCMVKHDDDKCIAICRILIEAEYHYSIINNRQSKIKNIFDNFFVLAYNHHKYDLIVKLYGTFGVYMRSQNKDPLYTFNMKKFLIDSLISDRNFEFVNYILENIMFIQHPNLIPVSSISQQLKNICIDLDDPFLLNRLNFVDHISVVDLFTECCIKNKINIVKSIYNKHKNFIQNYIEECDDDFINVIKTCCNNRHLEIITFLRNICRYLIINNIDFLDNAPIKYKILEHTNEYLVNMLGLCKTLPDELQPKDNICIICHGKYNIILKCGHTYCVNCVHRWFYKLNNEQKCAICSTEFMYSEMNFIESLI